MAEFREIDGPNEDEVDEHPGDKLFQRVAPLFFEGLVLEPGDPVAVPVPVFDAAVLARARKSGFVEGDHGATVSGWKTPKGVVAPAAGDEDGGVAGDEDKEGADHA